MAHEIIEAADDPRLAPYRNLRDRDLLRDDLFIAEGKVVLDVLLATGRFRPHSVLLLDRRVAGLVDTLARVPAGVPILVAPEQVLDAVAGFHLHRGVLAAVHRRTPEDADALLAGLPARATIVAAIGIANHDNVGAIFRNAAAFGAAAVILDATSCDPLYRKAIRVSVGAALKVPFAIVEDALALPALLAAHGFDALALTPAGEMSIKSVTRSMRTALLLGAEGSGLPEAMMANMRRVGIPMAPGFDSLNVAAASAVALHRLFEP
jgi:tRNA G18 (ribose-2'-O)-methylase SpoU